MTEQRFGRYRLLSLLGRGGMGEVWRAVDTTKDREVALKVLGSWLGGDPDFAARFRREAALAARLNSPHIVPIHDYGEIDDRLFLDMQLIHGADLDALLADGPLPAARAVLIVTQVARALAAAHATGLVHRDIKPSNVLVSRTADGDDHAYLIDFGIARLLDGTRLSVSGSVIGTAAYMAPECFTGDGDVRSDVYSLGCVLHQALTGQPPFRASHPFAYANLHQNRPPPRPSAVNGEVPAALDAVVERALAKDPDERYPDATALAAAARSALGAGPAAGVVDPAPAAAVVTPGTPTHVLAGPPSSRRGVRTAVAAVAVAVLVVLGVVLHPWDRATDGGASSDGVAPTVQETAVTVPGSPTFAAMTQRGRAVVGVRMDQPGLGFRDAAGQYSGFDIEVARLVADRLGFGTDRIDYVPVPVADREDAIAKGTIDYFVGTYKITDARKQRVSFAGPYLTAGQSLLVRAGETAITGKDTLRGRTVCSVEGSVPLQRVRELDLTPAERIVGRQSYGECVGDLLEGSVDALTTDDSILKGYAAQNPARLKVVGEPFSTEPYGIGLAHDDAALRGTINDILATAEADGTWKRLYNETLGRSGVPAEPPALQRY